TPPTFIMPNNEDTTPDLILFSPNMKNFIENIDVIPDLGSEHYSKPKRGYNYEIGQIFLLPQGKYGKHQQTIRKLHKYQ
ncbi:hypothetical protein HHI36_019060, partial [Cryptolaemus montrouzieri]